MPLYCTKNHINPSGSGFCTSCGEVLWLLAGYTLASRYRIVQHLGHGGFGRTYLAEDLHRFNERCVLKQFAPQEQASSQLEKAKMLFEREASALYKLSHGQLPAFREFFTADLGKGATGLFLAQNYIEGTTYSDLPKPLSEEEITKLISQLLPVLTYIHSQGTIHRDISPDNLILRKSDRTPVLIDFGGVKQLVTASLNQNGQVLTKLGKQGYAPEEQLRSGEVLPSSDLYALAVTALVLVTGKEPDELYDSYKGTWRWGKEIKVSAKLEKVLKKMLAYKPSDRYKCALDVAKALKLPNNLPEISNISAIATVNVIGRKTLPPIPSQPQGNTQVLVATPSFGWLKPLFLKVAGTGLLVLIVINVLPLLSSLKSLIPVVTPTTTVTDAQVANLVRRRQALKITSRFFNTTVNEAFYQKHPQLNRRSLKPAPQDADLRTDWYNIADDLLNKLDSLSPSARLKLGTYSKSTRHRLKPEIDRQFYQWFPQRRGKKLNPYTYGQIWEAIAFDQVSKLEKR
ncbi:serine/threonine-protein kinase [Synechocystis sp. PCC 7509]|uniref:serine/threonine-protein kinase n=1 Tax=Synechocystis sp. PCC 7509 TaxID=927677 RepID=UPI0002ABCFD0|nr:serine/threonine-protein kinase [Synechocystis sp. PCC 7509]